MILRRLSLTHWRAHAQLDLTFSAGLNVVVGRNESGKSSLVEALDWALYRDITGGAGRLRADEIKCIVPATDPQARPRVEVEIEFSNCTAILSKVVCEDANKRECRLCLRQKELPDEWFERTEAQAKLRALLAADGISAAVVSLPCWELFDQQEASYRDQVLGGVPRFGVEAAVSFGWDRWLGPDGVFIGMTGYGASGPFEELYAEFGITPEAVAIAVRKRLGTSSQDS